MIMVPLGKIRRIDQISSVWPRRTQGLEDLLNYFAHSEVADSSHPVCPTISQSTSVYKTLNIFVQDPGVR
jgi:hypothetical protein